MITIYSVISHSLPPINFKKIEHDMEIILRENEILSAKIDVKISEHSEITNLAMKYWGESEEEANDHPVLSFATQEVEYENFIFHPEEENYLGEIIVSFEKAAEDAKNRSVSIEESISDLACHGLLHLIGIHHD